MATPQRQPDQTPRQRELENMQHGGVEREVSSGWRFGFWWLWILVIVGIWYVGFGWGDHGGWFRAGRRAANVQPTNDAQLSGPGLPILNANNKQNYVGQAFEIRNVPVEKRAGNQAMWIGSATNSTPMLLVATGAANNAASAAILPGQRVDANGKVVKAPPAAEAKQEWSLSDNGVQQLEQEGAYIAATQVSRVQP